MNVYEGYTHCTVFYLLPTAIPQNFCIAAYRAIRWNMRKKCSEETTRWILAGLAPYEPEHEALQFDTKNGCLLFQKWKLLQIFKVHSQRECTLACRD